MRRRLDDEAGRHVVQSPELTDVLRVAFGQGRHLRTTERVRGGSKKGVYRLSFDDASTAILYVWDPEENYWPAARTNAPGGDPFSDASGLELFSASYAYLDRIGVRIPQVYFADASKSSYPADVALVEDVRGGTLETCSKAILAQPATPWGYSGTL